MNLIKISNQLYPYTISELKQDNPNVSFPRDLTGVDLSLFDAAEVITDPPPQHNSNIETIEPLLPELIEGVWRVQWQTRNLTPEEIKARLPVDWIGFNESIAFDENMITYEFIANAIHPSIVGKKDLAYSIIDSKGIDNFALAFPLFCVIAGVSQEHRNEWANMAIDCNLPQDFIDIVRG